MRNNDFSSFTRRALLVVGAMVFVLFASSQASAQSSVTASWDRNTDSFTAGYRLFYGTSTGNYQWSVDVGNQNSAPLNLSPGRYFFTVRGYTTTYQQGPQAAEATLTIVDEVAPTTTIQASLQNGMAVVTWQSANAVAATINGTNVTLSGSTSVAVSATTTFTIVVRNARGVTATASATVTVNVVTPPVAPTAPLAPTAMAASVSGTRVTLSWQPNSAGGTPTQYVLYVGTTAWGTEVVKAQSLGNVLSVTADLPPGTYYARVRARNAAGISASNSPVRFVITR